MGSIIHCIQQITRVLITAQIDSQSLLLGSTHDTDFNHVQKSCNSCNCIAWAQKLSICSSSTDHWDLNHSEQSVPQDLQHAVSPTAHFRYLVLSHSVGNKHYHYTMYSIIYTYRYIHPGSPRPNKEWSLG